MIQEVSHYELFYNILVNLGWKASEISKEKSFALKKGCLDIDLIYKALNSENDIELIVVHPTDYPLPAKKDFYQHFLDHNFIINSIIRYFTDKLNKKSPILLMDTNRSYLIDAENYEVLLYCDSKKEQQENLYPYLEKRKISHGLVNLISGKSFQTHGKELADWINLWVTDLGSRAGLPKKILESLFKNIIFLKTYIMLFPTDIPYLNFENFLQPDDFFLSKKTEIPKISFKNIENAISYLYYQKGIDFLKPDQNLKPVLNNKFVKESNLLWKFFSDINLLSLKKFSLDSLLITFASESDYYKTLKAKFSDTEIKISEKLVHENFYIYTPIELSIPEKTFQELISVYEKLVVYWIEYNERLSIELRRKINKTINIDMFMEMPEYISKNGMITNIIAFVTDYCLKIKASSPEYIETAEFLIYLKTLFLIKKYNLNLLIFPSLKKIFI